MNLETLRMVLYALITIFITVYVGRVLFRNGRPFLEEMLRDVKLTNAVNNVLLTGYYLVNIGYVVVMLSFRKPVTDVASLTSSLARSVSIIVLTLGVMHFVNIGAAVLWKKTENKHKHLTI